MDSFLLCLSAACQQRKLLTSRFFDPLSCPPLPSTPSLLSFTRQFHFYHFMKMQPFPFTSPAAQTHGRQIGPILASSTASSNGAAHSSQVVYFRGPSQFVMRPPIGCGPGPLLGSHARPAWIPDACKPCIRGEFKPLRVNPLPCRTMSLGILAHAVRGEKGLVRAREERLSSVR